jgi:hypothetical protein
MEMSRFTFVEPTGRGGKKKKKNWTSDHPLDSKGTEEYNKTTRQILTWDH